MSVFCEMPKCGARLPNADALAAHRRFIHEDPLAAVPEQPSQVASTKAAVAVLHGTQKKALAATRVMGGGGGGHAAWAASRHEQAEKIETVRKAKVSKIAAKAKTLADGILLAGPDRIGIRKDDMTREQWLLHAVEKMRPDFAEVGREVPPVRISIGWPGGRAARLDPLGQCWAPGAVADGIAAIFITPSQDDPIQILATTRHEMVHAAGEMHHRAGFRRLARDVGFDPRPGASGTSSTYRTPELQAKLEALYAELGPFPHARVSKGVTLGGMPKVQSTRMLKVVCRRDGYAVRTTAKWIEVGLPSCPKGHLMKVVAA